MEKKKKKKKVSKYLCSWKEEKKKVANENK